MRCNLGVLKLYVKTFVEVPLAGIITQKEFLQKLALSLQSSHDILHCMELCYATPNNVGIFDRITQTLSHIYRS